MPQIYESLLHGTVAPGFEEVREEFRKNFAERGELGAACCVYHNRAFGQHGAGGSMGFVDPDAQIGYAYVTNKIDFYIFNDPLEKALCDACYRCLGRTAATG